jgi:serine/threonine-protein kinase
MPPAAPGASPAPVPDELFMRLQTALAGEYSLERELGRGGMGVVYLAREVRLAREVAIKLLPPALAERLGMREQFLREAQIAARLSHPNIVPIHRVDEARGLVYFVMAYVPGETLAQRVRQHGPLAVRQTAQVLRDVAWALTYAHASGIVHRDVKAENILLERGTGRALMTDFGIASVAHAMGTRDADGAVAGSAHYASPEQIAGEPPDAASDLYSLGVVGFLALTGRLPFDAPTTRAVIAMHLNTRPPSIAALAPTVPPRFAQLIDRCLAKRPEHRFHTASEFAEALDHAVEKPRDIPAPIRVWLARTGQRRRVAVVASLYVSAVGSFPLTLSLHLGLGGIFAFGGLLVATLGLSVWVPWLYSTRKVLSAGYDVNDLRVAVRDSWVRRHEELVYEQASGFRLPLRVLLPVFATSASVTAALIASGWGHPVGIAVSGAIAAVSGVLSLGVFIRTRVIAGLGRRQVKFYHGRWGERFVRFAGLGLKKRTADHALPQLTEVALGRATDALYDALPKSLRKELKQLPGAVRRLEDDARVLRAELDKLDASIASLDSDAGVATSATLAASPRDTKVQAERDRLRRDLRLTRERAGDRLAATVAALENIRLDLLRLQLGDGRVESVTASLYAARQIADDVGAYVDATKEVEASLASPKP